MEWKHGKEMARILSFITSRSKKAKGRTNLVFLDHTLKGSKGLSIFLE